MPNPRFLVNGGPSSALPSQVVAIEVGGEPRHEQCVGARGEIETSRRAGGEGSWGVSAGNTSTIADSRIAAWGIGGGVHGLVNRWRARAARLAGGTLTWEYQEAGLFPARHQAPADDGIFVLDPIGMTDDWVLKCEYIVSNRWFERVSITTESRIPQGYPYFPLQHPR